MIIREKIRVATIVEIRKDGKVLSYMVWKCVEKIH